jgi:hypothetical protein
MLEKIGKTCFILVIIGIILSVIAGAAAGVDNLLAPYGGWLAAPLTIKVGVFGGATLLGGCVGVVCCMLYSC